MPRNFVGSATEIPMSDEYIDCALSLYRAINDRLAQEPFTEQQEAVHSQCYGKTISSLSSHVLSAAGRELPSLDDEIGFECIATVNGSIVVAALQEFDIEMASNYVSAVLEVNNDDQIVFMNVGLSCSKPWAGNFSGLTLAITKNQIESMDQFSARDILQKQIQGETHPILFRAVFETPNFVLEAYGSSKTQAIELLKDGWKVHCDQTGACPGYIDEYFGDIKITECKSGLVTRDNQELETGAKDADKEDSHKPDGRSKRGPK